jgi:hypothetical protein
VLVTSISVRVAQPPSEFPLWSLFQMEFTKGCHLSPDTAAL